MSLFQSFLDNVKVRLLHRAFFMFLQLEDDPKKELITSMNSQSTLDLFSPAVIYSVILAIVRISAGATIS